MRAGLPSVVYGIDVVGQGSYARCSLRKVVGSTTHEVTCPLVVAVVGASFSSPHKRSLEGFGARFVRTVGATVS